MNILFACHLWFVAYILLLVMQGHYLLKLEWCNINFYFIIYLRMTLVILVLFLLITLSQAGSISNAPHNLVSNIPVIVSPNKNYTTSQPRWLSSPFFRAGNEAVIKTLTGKDKTPTYTFTFSSALPGLPSLAYGIKNYRGIFNLI